MSDFQSISTAFADAVGTVAGSTVRVSARKRFPASGVVWSSDGVIVTANHVVQRDEDIHVGLPNGEDVPATLVGRDPSTDLAVLRVEGSTLTAASWVEEAEIRVGALVVAVGRPRSGVEAALGVLSAVGGAWRTGGGGQVTHFIKPDLVMYPGFSGGALIGGSGVIGLLSSALVRDSGVALPAATVKPVVETLLAHGHMQRGYLGVGVQAVKLSAAQAEEFGQATGLLVTSVDDGSPAQTGGLLVGDILASFDGEAVRRPDDLSVLLIGSADKTVALQLVRGGAAQAMSLTVGQRA
ncbi:MAG: trypsin-like peptidase domain-containing protein [Caldilineaceae bacterium]|nr:trypsin-like peptidase domain-containing protein [Caldilineaceae bacterium]